MVAKQYYALYAITYEKLIGASTLNTNDSCMKELTCRMRNKTKNMLDLVRRYSSKKLKINYKSSEESE